MRAIVLGAAAGGGLPQWNCGCENCRLARAGDDPGGEPVVARGERRRARLGDPERLAGHARPAGGDAGAASDRSAREPAAGGAADQRRYRPCRRAARRCGRGRRSSCSPRRRSSRCWRRTGSSTRSTRRWCRGGRCGSASAFELVPGLTAELFAVPGKVPLYLEGETVATDLEGEQTVGVARRSGARLLRARLRRGDAGAGRAARAGRRGVLRRDALARRRDDPGRASAQRPGGGWGTCAMRRAGRVDRRLRRARGRAAGSSCTSTTPTRCCGRARPSGRRPRRRAGRSRCDGMEVAL